jgi:hypothetical protein
MTVTLLASVQGTEKKIAEMQKKNQLEILGKYYTPLLNQVNSNKGFEKIKCNDLDDYHYILDHHDKEICLPESNCQFYKCMEKKYSCSSVNVKYFKDLAFPTCSMYVTNMKVNKFSDEGIEWIYSVMLCLQKGLVDECELGLKCDKGNTKASCDYITKFTLEFHPGCYLNSGVGVCQLSAQDQLAILNTVGPFLTFDESIEALKTSASCLKEAPLKGVLKGLYVGGFFVSQYAQQAAKNLASLAK